MSTTESTGEQTRAIVADFYAKLGSGAWDDALAMLHEDVEASEPPALPYGGLHRGRAAMRRMFETVGSLYDFTETAMEGLAVDGELAVAMMRSKVAATGEPLLVAEEFLVRDGLIVRIRVLIQDPEPLAKAAIAAGIS